MVRVGALAGSLRLQEASNTHTNTFMKSRTLHTMVAALALGVSPLFAQTSFIVESRSGGLNYANYTDSGFADSSGAVNAPGCTLNIGSRYSGTGTYFGPSRYAQFTFTPTVSGTYEIDLAWPSTAGQISTAVNLYTGAATGSTDADIWGNTGGPLGIVYSGTMDMYYKNVGVWNLFTTADLTAGTTYHVGIYGGYKTPYTGGVTPDDTLANRVCAGAVQFAIIPEPSTVVLGLLGGFGLLAWISRRRNA